MISLLSAAATVLSRTQDAAQVLLDLDTRLQDRNPLLGGSL
jgi:hypothetical protein